MEGGSCGMSCGAGAFGGMEFFENSPYVPAPVQQLEKQTKDDNKNKTCHYTAQGELLCGLQDSERIDPSKILAKRSVS
jgi:hypothetical protein